jgi:AcrR family transcriptional regulator
MADVKRQYHSPTREEQARATRRRIVDAALALFSTQGFAGTSVKEVAERASVSEQTVYNAFGDKVGLLVQAALAYMETGGGGEEATLLAALEAEPDPLARIRMVARNSRELWTSAALELDLMVFNAEDPDPRLDELQERALAYKLKGNREVLTLLFPDEIRRPGISVEDIAAFGTAVDSAATVTTLRALGWSMDQWEAWLVQLLTLFLDPRRIAAND